jgi:hypothetical protein
MNRRTFIGSVTGGLFALPLAVVWLAAVAQQPPRVPRVGWLSPNAVRSQPSQQLPAGRHLCGQDPKRRQASRLTRGAAHQVRAGDQHEDGEGARYPDPAVASASRGRDDSVIGSGRVAHRFHHTRRGHRSRLIDILSPPELT